MADRLAQYVLPGPTSPRPIDAGPPYVWQSLDALDALPAVAIACSPCCATPGTITYFEFDGAHFITPPTAREALAWLTR